MGFTVFFTDGHEPRWNDPSRIAPYLRHRVATNDHRCRPLTAPGPISKAEGVCRSAHRHAHIPFMPFMPFMSMPFISFGSMGLLCVLLFNGRGAAL